ncbi:MAG TPA: hypothetical protein VLL54_15555 [Pyrinomonadaceae bacterium]|nr:hypothetical protein [Pyrinomonadaceae bacterium]
MSLEKAKKLRRSARKDGERFELTIERLLKQIETLEAATLKIASFVAVASVVASMFSLKMGSVGLTNPFEKGELRQLILIVLAGTGGIIALSVTIFVFVYFLRGKTKKVKGLEIQVISAFIKALDDSPLRSHRVDNEYREQLTSP